MHNSIHFLQLYAFASIFVLYVIYGTTTTTTTGPGVDEGFDDSQQIDESSSDDDVVSLIKRYRYPRSQHFDS